jgi:hypothetical protein
LTFQIENEGVVLVTPMKVSARAAVEQIGKYSQCRFFLDIEATFSNLVEPTVRVPIS